MRKFRRRSTIRAPSTVSVMLASIYAVIAFFLLTVSAGPAARRHLPLSNNTFLEGKNHIFYSWSAGFRIATNASHHSIEERPHRIVATGTDINGTLGVDDFFPYGYVAGSLHGKNKTSAATIRPAELVNINGTIRRSRRDARDDQELEEALAEGKAKHDKKEGEEEHESEDEFELSPEMKVKIYSGIILGTIFLVVFVMCIWPLFKCCRTCCQVGTTGCLACWDLLHCRDPGYRLMCLAAKQAGLDPPTPEEYDTFMSGWEDKGPELIEALMD